MKKILALSAILLVLLTGSVSFAKESKLKHIFRIYDNKTTVFDFVQTSINAMSGQKITKRGRLKIVPKEYMTFDYKNERVIINNFEVVDYSNSKESIYKLESFNKVLFLLFLGKKDIGELFKIDKNGDGYVLIPKYKSNIEKVYAFFKSNTIDNLTIVDIYSNRTIYQFYDSSCKRTQKGN